MHILHVIQTKKTQQNLSLSKSGFRTNTCEKNEIIIEKKIHESNRMLIVKKTTKKNIVYVKVRKYKTLQKLRSDLNFGSN
jgi:hypothetical protein